MNTKDKSLLLTTYKDSLDNNNKKSDSPLERARKVTKRKFFKKQRKQPTNKNNESCEMGQGCIRKDKEDVLTQPFGCK